MGCDAVPERVILTTPVYVPAWTRMVSPGRTTPTAFVTVLKGRARVPGFASRPFVAT
jgi:hypothetical protein